MNDLVSITAYLQDPNLIGPPLAVGRMALHSNQLPGDGKGKAVNILHTYEDSLWALGSKSEPPEPIEVKPDPPATATPEEPTLEKVDTDAQNTVVSSKSLEIEPPAPTTDETQETPAQTLTTEGMLNSYPRSTNSNLNDVRGCITASIKYYSSNSHTVVHLTPRLVPYPFVITILLLYLTLQAGHSSQIWNASRYQTFLS